MGRLGSSLPGSPPHSPFVRRAKGGSKAPAWLPPGRKVPPDARRIQPSAGGGERESSGGNAGALRLLPSSRSRRAVRLPWPVQRVSDVPISPLGRRANCTRGWGRGNPPVTGSDPAFPKTSRQVLPTSRLFRSFRRTCWERLVAMKLERAASFGQLVAEIRSGSGPLEPPKRFWL